MELNDEGVLLLSYGLIRCSSSSARSHRTNFRTGSPEMNGKRVCRTHGGKSTGPKTEQGKANSAKANLKNGKYTKQAQTEHSEASAQLSQLEDAMYLLGMSNAPRCAGRKASAYCKLESLDDVRAMLAKTIAE